MIIDLIIIMYKIINNRERIDINNNRIEYIKKQWII